MYKRKVVAMLVAVMFLSAALFSLTGCKKPGEEFVGKWRNTKEPKFTAKISRTGGDEFQVTSRYETWKKDSEPLYLDYKNGRLTEHTAGQFNITYNKETGTVTMPDVNSGYPVEWAQLSK